MKTGDNIIPNMLSESDCASDRERFVINCWLPIINAYCNYQIDSLAQKYIDGVLHVVDFLYQFYDLNPIYFSLLDKAACTLEKLASTDDQREMLAEYFDKTAVIFLTAADKTKQGSIYKETWSIKATEYKEKADSIMGITSDAAYKERIIPLYRTLAEKMPHEFTKILLLENYRRYESEKPAITSTPPQEIRRRHVHTDEDSQQEMVPGDENPPPQTLAKKPSFFSLSFSRLWGRTSNTTEQQSLLSCKS